MTCIGAWAKCWQRHVKFSDAQEKLNCLFIETCGIGCVCLSVNCSAVFVNLLVISIAGCTVRLYLTYTFISQCLYLVPAAVICVNALQRGVSVSGLNRPNVCWRSL